MYAHPVGAEDNAIRYHSWTDPKNSCFSVQVCSSETLVAAACLQNIAAFSYPNLGVPPGEACSKVFTASCPEAISELQWLKFCVQPQGHSNSGHENQCAHKKNLFIMRAHGSASQRSISCHTFLLVGTMLGYLMLFDMSGKLLWRQRLHTGQVLKIHLPNVAHGFQVFEDGPEEITVVYEDCVMHMNCWDLYHTSSECWKAVHPEHLTQDKGKAQWFHDASASTLGTGKHLIDPIPVQKWELPSAIRGCKSAVCLGRASQDLYAMLQGNNSGTSKTKEAPLLFCVGAESPCLCLLEANKVAGHGALAVIQSLASSIGSVTSQAFGLARVASNTVTKAPSNLATGLKSMIFSPFAGSSRAHHSQPNSKQQKTSSSSSSSDLWSPPLRSDSVPNRCEVSMLTCCWRDEGRATISQSLSPGGRLLASVDSLGRVMLLEGRSLHVIRMWKGYRDAQCGWLQVDSDVVSSRVKILRRLHHKREIKEEEFGGFVQEQRLRGEGKQRNSVSLDVEFKIQEKSEHTPSSHSCHSDTAIMASSSSSSNHGDSESVLAIYVPRRNLVELWQPVRGMRLGVFTGWGSDCHLVSAVLHRTDHQGAPDHNLEKDGSAVATTLNGAQDQHDMMNGCLAYGKVTCLVVDTAIGAVTDLGEMLREHT
ncbi:hypothetical protein CEUSTIGMA_g1426.t1 [Chlamydomonas eustigma]|uniref:Rab3-GAP regulatory subunit N-terminal domain-containing protein n=1 Tax=Chlamydomonas eustigma TaxID=1157962 RepID=A0A250WTA1_9CHLO|nr:hypothetical protein CEUSTIGMA_g1426.t1 [Chlamydomonas eustigma]|eukprot:GAX73976.1 hypothetical protein CEUSTIGMA_g1426.t1 [Chlamydomonas eustigma]